MSHKNDEKGNRNFSGQDRYEFMSSMSKHSRKGSLSDVVSTNKDISLENRGSREMSRKQKYAKISRRASPDSSDCKIVDLAKTDSDS